MAAGTASLCRPRVILRRRVGSLCSSLLFSSTRGAFIHTHHAPDTTPGMGANSFIPQGAHWEQRKQLGKYQNVLECSPGMVYAALGED